MKYAFDYKEVQDLEKKIKQLPGIAEKAINEVLHIDGVEIVTKQVTHLIPVSTRDKRHARSSNWSTSEEGNLSFIVKSRGGAAKNKNSFGYLVFPDEGRGRSNPEEQNFTERAMEAAMPEVLKKMDKKLNTVIQEGL